MLRTAVGLIIVVGIVGLILGYFIFAHNTLGGQYIPLSVVISGPRTGLGQLFGGHAAQLARTNILYSGLVGGIVGLVLSFFVRTRR